MCGKTQKLVRGAAPALFVVILVLASIAPEQDAAACSVCQCGDPTYRLLGDNIFGDWAWHASLDVDHLSKDQVSEGFPSGRERESENRLTGAISWSPLARLRVVGRLPVSWRTIRDPMETQTLFGLSDPDVYAHVDLFRRRADVSDWMAVMAGAKTPWGQNDRRVSGQRADEHLQPGTGAPSWYAGLDYSIATDAFSHWYASLIGRWNGENSHGYRYGDVLIANLAYQHAISSWTSACGELNFRAAREDLDAAGVVANTGGSVLYVTPRVTLRMPGPWAVRLGVQIPVAQRLFGDQNEHANLQSGITVTY